MSLGVIELADVEQTVYETIVARQPVTAATLHDTCGIDESVLLLTIKSLESRGLVKQTADQPPRLVATPPDLALEALLLDKEQQIQRARLDVQRLASLHHQQILPSAANQVVEVIHGRDAVLERFEQAQRAARSEVRFIDKPPYACTNPTSNVDAETAMLQRGVRCRVIYDTAGLESYHRLTGDIQTYRRAGEQARLMADAPVKLMIVDDRLALMPLHATQKSIDCLAVVYPSAILHALGHMFEQLWDNALPLQIPDGERPAGPDGPTASERRLLGLLTAGLTDQTIAKHLGTSHRTVQRKVRALLQRLGAQTRFQAGLRAASLGWIPSGPEDGTLPRQPTRETAAEQHDSWM